MTATKKHIYGPVPSRRLGISLGVDMVPYKTCSYDCIYCQLGKTTCQTLERKPYVNTDSILNELKQILNQNSDIDYITFSGSGEPTLNKDIGQIIRRVKELTPIPVAVLTNGSLLWDEKVGDDLSPADLVVPSLDAISEEVFKKINQPIRSLKIQRILEGLRTFTQDFKGKVQLEIMLVKNVNDSKEEIKKINQFVGKLKIDRVQLNTVIRPPNDPVAKPLNIDELLKIKSYFDISSKVEIIPDFDRQTSGAYQKDLEQAIIELLKRRPTKKEEMAISLGIHPTELIKYLDILEKDKIIRRSTESEEEQFYFIKQG